MKSVFTAVVIGSFLSIAIFGVFAMNHGGEHNHGCIAATAQGVADCPNQANPFAFLTFHFDAFKSFSTATVGSPLTSALLISLALIFISFLALFFRDTAQVFSRLQAHQRKRQESFGFPFRLQLNHWLALHENSPSII